MMGWYGHGMGQLGWLGTSMFWLILLALIVWLVVRLLPSSDGGTRNTGESPLEVFDRRLPSGRIDLKAGQPQRVALLSAMGDRK